MDIFEKQELKKQEEQEYIKIAKKNKKTVRITLGATFSVIGLIFIIVAIMDFLTDFGEEFIIGIVYSIVGGAFLLTGILCYALINPEKIMPYEEYKEKMSKYSYTYATTMQVQMLEKRIELLEKKIEELSK